MLPYWHSTWPFLLCNGIDLDEDSGHSSIAHRLSSFGRRVVLHNGIAPQGLELHVGRRSGFDRKGVDMGSLVVALSAFSFDRFSGVPRSVPIILWFILAVWLSGSRLAYRAIKQDSLPGPCPRPARQCAGPGLRLRRSHSLFLRAVQSVLGPMCEWSGIIDEVERRCGRYLNNTPVLGQARDLERVLIDLAVQGCIPAS